jgi:hypothetical protein
VISHAFKLMGGCALLLVVIGLIISGLLSKIAFAIGMVVFTWAGILALVLLSANLITSALRELDV